MNASYLTTAPRNPAECAPLAFMLEEFGFFPNVYRAQALNPDVLNAEADAVRTVLLYGGLLPRIPKESIPLAGSAENSNAYFLAMHGEILNNLGVPIDQTDWIAIDHSQARLTEAECALLDFAVKLATRQQKSPSPAIGKTSRSLLRGGPQMRS